MLTSERKALILDRLAGEGRVLAADLARDWAVSEDTIRRDLRDLAAEGRLVRVHGGALPLSPTHLPLARRMSLRADEKIVLGQAGAALVQAGQIVLVDGGTTHLALIAAIPADLAFTLVTHSPGIAAAAERFAQARILLLGGEVFRHSMVALGAATLAALDRIQPDLAFVGVTGVHETAGLTTGDHEEALFKARMIGRAAETAVLVTGDKIGRASPYAIAPLTAAAHVITAGPRPDWLGAPQSPG